MWTYEIVDTITGDRLLPVLASKAPWSMRLNGQLGSGTLTIPVLDPKHANITAATWSRLRTAWACTIVGKWANVPIWAGPICATPKWNQDTGMLELPWAELGQILQKRLFFGAGLYSAMRGATFTNLSPQGLLTELARHVCGGGAGAPIGGTNSPWRLPVWFPDTRTGNRSYTSRQHMQERPWQLMTDITEEESGPDFSFAPGFSTILGSDDAPTAFQWVFQTGTPLERSVLEWQIDTENTPVSNLELGWDSAQQQTGVFMLGEGMGEDRPVGTATPNDSLRLPAMDVAMTLSREPSVAALNRAARGALQRLRQPVEVWSFKVRADVALVGDNRLRPGSRVRLRWGSHPILGGTGYRDLYVVGISGDEGPTVTVEVQTL